MPEEKTTKFCSNCGSEIDIKAKICPKCGIEQAFIPEKVSNWWYLLPIFFGIIGGIIAWAVIRNRDHRKAVRFVIVGIVLSLIQAILVFLIISSIVLVSLGGAREKAKDASIRSSMSFIRATAEEIYFEEGDDYSKVSCSHPEIKSICQDIKIQTGEEPTILSNQENYCAYIKLFSGDYFCIDTKVDAARDTSVYPGGAGYCNGITFTCP